MSNSAARQSENTSPSRAYYATWSFFPFSRAYLIICQWYSSRTTQTQPNPSSLETENFGEMIRWRSDIAIFPISLGVAKLFASNTSSPSNADALSSRKGNLASKSPSPPRTRRLAKSLLERGTLALPCVKFSVLIFYYLATGHIKYLEAIKGESTSPFTLRWTIRILSITSSTCVLFAISAQLGEFGGSGTWSVIAELDDSILLVSQRQLKSPFFFLHHTYIPS